MKFKGVRLINSVRRFNEVVTGRNGTAGSVLLMTYYYGKKLTNTERDELLICSRIAQQR